MKIGGCFVRTEKPGHHDSHGDLGGVPSTGTRRHSSSSTSNSSTLRPERSARRTCFYLGKAPTGGDIKFPMWFKHFGSGGNRTALARRITSASSAKLDPAKRALAKMLLAAYARHPDPWASLVIDPQGEFSLEFIGQS